MEPMKLSHTSVAQNFIDWKKQTLDTIKFLVNNRDMILNEEQKKSIYNQRPTIMTPMSMIFSHLVDSGVIHDLFCPIVVTSRNVKTSLPELLTNYNFLLNLNEEDHTDILNGFTDIKNKIVLNLTPWVSTTNGIYKITDVNNVYSMFVKGLLCASFSSNKNKWLTPTISSFIAKSYSMIISNAIASAFNLDITYEKFCRLVFGIYIIQKFNLDNYIPPSGLNMIANIIGNQYEIESMLEEAFQSKAFGLTFSDAVSIIQTKLSSRIPTFSEFNIVRMCTSLLGDTIASGIALEYPPYWVYGLILAASHGKNGMTFKLKQLKLENENKMFTDQLNRSTQFIELLRS
jgi:hypothetical protein